MGILQNEMPTQPGHFPSWEARSGWHLPSGWWVFPGVILGFCMWVMTGYGVHAALTGGAVVGQPDLVAQSTHMDI